MDHEIIGRKVFFMNPQGGVTDEIMEGLIAAEYEVLMLRDREKSLRVLHKYPDSVLFISIDGSVKEEVWEAYVRGIMGDPRLSGVRIGILSYNPTAELAKKYLIDIGVPCGFVRLKLGVSESTRIMLRALQANEARGRRKYVRVRPENDPHTGFNVEYKGQLHEGAILDISSVGMAAKFVGQVDIPPKTRLTELQLKLHTHLVRVTGVVLTRRDDDQSIYVILFQHSIETKARHQIRMYIHRRLQAEVDRIAGVDS